MNGSVMEHLSALRAASLPELIRLRSRTHPSKLFVRLVEPSGAEREITFAQFHRGVAAAAQHLVGHGVGPGDVVPIVLDTSEEFLNYFFGIMATRAIPVALPMPLTAPMMAATSNALSRIAPSFTVTGVEGLTDAVAGLRVIHPTQPASTAGAVPADARPQDAAMMQFSSGTTASPKGILLSHYNLLANCEVFGGAAGITEADAGISWLPLFHDMGLVGTVIGSLYYAMTLTLMSPIAFVMRPLFWLQAIGKYGATITAAPNSAFEMCMRRVNDADADGLDLSSLRVIFCGAELVREQTIRRFAGRFAAAGLRSAAFFPVYGLAESTLAVSLPEPGAEMVVDRVEADGFAPGSRAVSSDRGTHFVSVGRAGRWHEVKVMDGDGREVEEGTIGYVRIKGPCVMMRYHDDPEATAAVLDDGWLKTNDLAYMRNGNLFICGRDSDLIIKAGRNLSPTEVEDACQRLVPDLTRLAAFGVYDERQGTEMLVVMGETKVPAGPEQDRLRLRMRGILAQHCGIEVDHIWLVPPRTIPHTTSGKVQRRRCREMWKESEPA